MNKNEIKNIFLSFLKGSGCQRLPQTQKWAFSEEIPKAFLDTKTVRKNDTILTKMFTKLTRYPVHWSSKILTNYKRDAIAGELNRVKKILRFNKGLHLFFIRRISSVG